MQTNNEKTMAEWLQNPTDPKIEEQCKLEEQKKKEQKEEDDRRAKKKKDDDDLMLILACSFCG